MTRELRNHVRAQRERLGLSQKELADAVGVTRQAIIGVEQGRRVPSTTLALSIARALRSSVDELFTLEPSTELRVRVAPQRRGLPSARRVTVAEVAGSWVAHPLSDTGTNAADGILHEADGSTRVEPLVDPSSLSAHVLVSGCAPILGMLSERVGARHVGTRASWLPGSSRTSLDLLEDGLIHVAGVHLSGPGNHEAIVRERFPAERMLIMNLTRWREGFVVKPGNPEGIRDVDGLLRGELRFARRERGSGADRLVRELLREAGAESDSIDGPEAAGHIEVAELVRCGAVDAGVAIESVALAAGLDFVPLAEERFDLVLPAAFAETPSVRRFLEAIDDRSFRSEMALVPGYDPTLCGQVSTLEAA